MGFKTILFEVIEPSIGLITLNRPARLNALSLELLDELHRLYDQLQNSPEIRMVILTGSGRGFCSGADLKDERSGDRSDRRVLNATGHLFQIQKKFSSIILRLRAIPQPVISAVNGPAAGGGMCLALASDVVLASPKAAFTPSFINIGLSGGELGSTFLLQKAVGNIRAAEILLTGRTVNAYEAEKIGMVNRVVEEERLLEAALGIARLMKDKSPTALRLTKEALNQNLTAPSLEAAINLEDRNQSISVFTDEFLKAVKDFSDRKK
ncbi:MAG: enoyl-CoA hydratase/isomerase family protein [Thermodesulfobacteriota bacterium]